MNISITMFTKQTEKPIETVLSESYAHGIGRLLKADSIDEVKFMQGYLLSIENFAGSLGYNVKVEVLVK